MIDKNVVIGVVGVCGSGKTELVQRLKAHGYQARHIAQEHSHVPDMWQRLSNPNVLVFLEVTFQETMRRKPFNWNEAEYKEELRRLRHAYEHADIFVNTNQFDPDGVCEFVLRRLREDGHL